VRVTPHKEAPYRHRAPHGRRTDTAPGVLRAPRLTSLLSCSGLHRGIPPCCFCLASNGPRGIAPDLLVSFSVPGDLCGLKILTRMTFLSLHLSITAGQDQPKTSPSAAFLV
jgi:hypothetical protein